MLKKTLALITLTFYALVVFDLFTKYEADVVNGSVDSFIKSAKPSVTSARAAANLSIELNDQEPSYFIDRAKVKLLELPLDKKSVLSDIETAQNLNPNNLATLRNSVPYYYFLSLKEYRLPASASNIDTEYLDIVKKHYLNLETRFSTDAGVLVLLHKYYKKLNLNEDVARVDEKILKLRPDLLEWAVN